MAFYFTLIKRTVGSHRLVVQNNETNRIRALSYILYMFWYIFSTEFLKFSHFSVELWSTDVGGIQ